LPLLLDSHIFQWSITGSPKLPQDVIELINKEEHVFVSIASLWELTIKSALGKINFSNDVFDKFESRGYRLLPINNGSS